MNKRVEHQKLKELSKLIGISPKGYGKSEFLVLAQIVSIRRGGK